MKKPKDIWFWGYLSEWQKEFFSYFFSIIKKSDALSRVRLDWILGKIRVYTGESCAMPSLIVDREGRIYFNAFPINDQRHQRFYRSYNSVECTKWLNLLCTHSELDLEFMRYEAYGFSWYGEKGYVDFVSTVNCLIGTERDIFFYEGCAWNYFIGIMDWETYQFHVNNLYYKIGKRTDLALRIYYKLTSLPTIPIKPY